MARIVTERENLWANFWISLTLSVGPLHCAARTFRHTHSLKTLNFSKITHRHSRVTVQKLHIVGKKFKYNKNTQDLCLHFKAGMVFPRERMPEQEMFEKHRRFASFLTSSHSFLMGNLSQFFATYVAKNSYSGEKNNSNPSPPEPHVLIYNSFVCAQRCGVS